MNGQVHVGTEVYGRISGMECLIVASISTELENSDEDIPDKDVEQAVAINKKGA